MLCVRTECVLKEMERQGGVRRIRREGEEGEGKERGGEGSKPRGKSMDSFPSSHA